MLRLTFMCGRLSYPCHSSKRAVEPATGNGGAKICRRRTYLDPVNNVAAGTEGRLDRDAARPHPVRIGMSLMGNP